jgi:hypothetical protein
MDVKARCILRWDERAQNKGRGLGD